MRKSGDHTRRTPIKTIYLIGSLRNPDITHIGNSLRDIGFDVFDDWFAAGPEADDYWQEYEQERGRSYGEALNGYAARDVYEFDKRHLDRSDIVVLAMPAGKSGHLEFGYCIGKGKTGYILFDEEPDRWDVMYQFADGVFFSLEDLLAQVSHEKDIERRAQEHRILEETRMYP